MTQEKNIQDKIKKLKIGDKVFLYYKTAKEKGKVFGEIKSLNFKKAILMLENKKETVKLTFQEITKICPKTSYIFSRLLCILICLFILFRLYGFIQCTFRTGIHDTCVWDEEMEVEHCFHNGCDFYLFDWITGECTGNACVS